MDSTRRGIRLWPCGHSPSSNLWTGPLIDRVVME